MTRRPDNPSGEASGGPTIASIPPAMARSWLLVSATNQIALAGAMTSDADAVIVDLEDGVPFRRRAAARSRLADVFDGRRELWLRINDATTDDWAADLDALTGLIGLRGIVLAKAETVAQVELTAARLAVDTPVIALIESARGLVNAVSIAESPSVIRLAFGTGDFRRDTGIGDNAAALAYARSQLVVASAAARIPAPIDGPTPGGDREQVLGDARLAGVMGMAGKLCLVEHHVDPINRGFSPDVVELEYALELLRGADAADGAGFDGSYLPRIAQARSLVERAHALGLRA